jgi:hypothetical protein
MTFPAGLRRCREEHRSRQHRKTQLHFSRTSGANAIKLFIVILPEWRHDTQNYNAQHNDTQYNNAQYNNTQYNCH